MRLLEERLAFYRRFLPENRAQIGGTMFYLAYTYSYLQMHDKALRMREQALAFCKSVLPGDHAVIGSFIKNMTLLPSHNLGRHDERRILLNQVIILTAKNDWSSYEVDWTPSKSKIQKGVCLISFLMKWYERQTLLLHMIYINLLGSVLYLFLLRPRVFK